MVVLVNSDSQSKFLSESGREGGREGGRESARMPDLELLLCETESELKIQHNNFDESRHLTDLYLWFPSSIMKCL